MRELECFAPLTVFGGQLPFFAAFTSPMHAARIVDAGTGGQRRIQKIANHVGRFDLGVHAKSRFEEVVAVNGQ